MGGNKHVFFHKCGMTCTPNVLEEIFFKELAILDRSQNETSIQSDEIVFRISIHHI